MPNTSNVSSEQYRGIIETLRHDLSTDEDFAVRKFREAVQADDQRARDLHALAHSFVEGAYPEHPPIIKSALKWAFLSGLAIDSYIEGQIHEVRSLEEYMAVVAPDFPEAA